MRTGVVASSLAAVLAASTPAVASASNAAWVASARVLAAGSPPTYDGAIAQYPDVPLQRVQPYWAGYAAAGLAASGDPAALGHAWAWLEWHQSRMDADGYVTDHLLTPVGTDPESYVETSAGPFAYDAADAYAATFLIALHRAHLQQPSRGRLVGFRSGVQKAVGLLETLQDPVDGLVWNLPPAAERPGDPRQRVKLLMDQAEVYAGLRAGAVLASAMRSRKLEARATEAAGRLRGGVASLWDPSVGTYAWAKLEDGALARSSWLVWYPDTLAQGVAVAMGNRLAPGSPLLDPGHAASLVATLASSWPEWSQPGFAPSAPRLAGTGSGRLGYQPLLGAAFAAVGREPEGLAGVEAIDGSALAAGRPWPFNVGTAGQIMLVRQSPD